MQTFIPKLEREANKLKSKRSRKRLGKWKCQLMKEKQWLAKLSHKSTGYSYF